MFIAEFLQKVQDIYQTGKATEHSYRSALEFLFASVGDNIVALNEPKAVKVGRPDFVVQRGELTLGHCEAKDVGLDISPRAMNDANKNQFERYSKAFPNLIYTNCLDFAFYKNGELVRQISIADFLLGIQPKPDQFEALTNQLEDFATAKLQTITSSKTLAELMAGKAGLIKDLLANALKDDPDLTSELAGQYSAFKEQLIHDLTPGEFADIYAETIAYGMFAARLHDTSLDSFSREEALILLPKSNPFLRNLFAYVAGPTLDERLVRTIDELAEIFQATDLAKLFADFGSFTKRNDPFIHFYETFLAKYNPKKRKSRGVWYTPEPVVNFIVRAVDDVLKSEFGLADGLADTSKVSVGWDTGQNDKRGKPITIKKDLHRVQILDPATGTGTFLAEVIKQIAPKIKDVAPGMWSSYIENDLIPRIHGFEFLMASYAMCHMKLDMMLTELGYEPSRTPPRLGVYLTNSLEEGQAANQTLPFAQWLSNEVKQANTIKRDMPIMCVIGNPPYSVSSSNKGQWITSLVADYKKDLNEKNIQPLSDDYIKFIRFSQHLIEKNGEGVLGFITNNSYLDGLIHRQMRKELLKCFDKIYIIDLHGSINKKETSPDGSKDVNVFDIQQGVAIIIAVNNRKTLPHATKNCRVFHTDLWGTHKSKNDSLQELAITNQQLLEIKPINPNFLFTPMDIAARKEYDCGFAIVTLMLEHICSLTTARDRILIHFQREEVKKTLLDLTSLEEAEFRNLYQEHKDSRDWLLKNAQEDAKLATIEKLLYRPFDNRFIPYTPNSKGVLQYPRHAIMKHVIGRSNISFSIPKQAIERPGAIVTENMIGHKSFSAYNRNYLFPLYLYPEEQDLDQSRRINMDEKILKKFAANLGLDYAPSDISKTSKNSFSELNIFDYIYGVLHCPTYRDTYREFLKIDFPRIPYPSSPTKFWDIVAKGNALRSLHLMEDAAIGKTPFPFEGDGDTIVEKIRFEATTDSTETTGAVFINKTQYFTYVPTIAWEFYIGGYQPAQKWLKDRKTRKLSFDDVRHYQKIIKILSETDKIMKTIKMDL